MEKPHKNVGEAIADTATAVAEARGSIDMDRRTAWFFVAEETLKEWATKEGIDETLTMEVLACRHFNKADTTPVRKGLNMRDRTLYAVWNGKEPEPTFEPDF